MTKRGRGRPPRRDGRTWRTIRLPLSDKEWGRVKRLNGDGKMAVLLAGLNLKESPQPKIDS